MQGRHYNSTFTFPEILVERLEAKCIHMFHLRTQRERHVISKQTNNESRGQCLIELLK